MSAVSGGARVIDHLVCMHRCDREAGVNVGLVSLQFQEPCVT